MARPEKKKSALVRAFRMSCVFAEFFLWYRLNHHRYKTFGARVREACERLGLVFIKIGQILSTRYDLLRKEDCEELQKLLDEVPAIPYAAVEQIFVNDFGRPPAACFDFFDPQPIASASISQVYQALLHGRKVAVKVRRPGVTESLAADVKVFRWLARLSRMFSRTLRHIDLQEILDQAESWMWTETDFLNEANHLEIVGRYYDEIGGREVAGAYGQAIVFPAPHREFCSQNVLTMDFLEGVSVRNFRSIVGNPAYDPETSLTSLVRAVLRNWMTQDELYFHGDPHPSNILIMPGGRIGLLDLGLLGRFDRDQVQRTRELFLAVYTKDVDRSLDILFDLCKAPRALRTGDLRESVAAYIEKAHRSGLGYWFSGVIDVCIAHKVPLPYDLVLFGRMQTIIDGLFKTVMPEKTTIDILGEELARALKRRILENIREIDLAPLAYAVSEKLRESPEVAIRFISRYFDEPLDLLRDIAAALRVPRDTSRHDEN